MTMTKLERVEAKRPNFPGWDASQQEREWHAAAMLRWLPSYEKALCDEYGNEYAARVVEQERMITELVAMTPERLKSLSRVCEERLRELFPGGIEVKWPDGTEQKI
jgi:hypothetical protein